MARALEVPLYHVVYDNDKPPKARDEKDKMSGKSRGTFAEQAVRCLPRMSEGDPETPFCGRQALHTSSTCAK
jgi:hypothetical protein